MGRRENSGISLEEIKIQKKRRRDRSYDDDYGYQSPRELRNIQNDINDR